GCVFLHVQKRNQQLLLLLLAVDRDFDRNVGIRFELVRRGQSTLKQMTKQGAGCCAVQLFNWSCDPDGFSFSEGINNDPGIFSGFKRRWITPDLSEVGADRIALIG